MKVKSGFVLSLLATAAFVAPQAQAGSAAQPGQTVGLPVGAPLPQGVYFVDTSSFGIRDTAPRSSASNINLPAVVWATPFKVAGGKLQAVFIQPVVAVSARGASYRRGTGQQLYAGQLAWDVGSGFGVSYLLGLYAPSPTPFVTQSASLSNRFAASYVADGYNLTAHLLYGRFLTDRSPTGAFYPDYVNLDLTATKKFGKLQIGPVAFGSTDLPTKTPGYRRQAQFAAGGLVGYTFDRFTLQSYVTRDVAQRNYGGVETRGWLRIIVPFFQDKDKVAPNRTLVTRRASAGG